MFSSQNSQVSSSANYIEDVFSTYLYTGNSSTQTITNKIDLAGKGGLVWTKSRVNAYNHALYDTSRGVNNRLNSNTTDAATAAANTLTAFNSNGFTLGNADGGNYAAVGAVSWTFRKQPKFFDVVTYTGTGSSQAIPHNLQSVPGCIMVKQIDGTATDWSVAHNSLWGSAKTLYLNLTSAAVNGFNSWFGTVPTSTNFYVNTDTYANDVGKHYVAYLFAHNAGGFGLTGTDNVISCGSFSTDSGGKATVNLGYEPQWVMFKRTDSSTFGNWYMIDNMRGFTNPSGSSWLWANSSSAEQTGINFSPESTGFSINFTGPANWIYIAIRRGPMKVPTDATKVFNTPTYSGTATFRTVTGVGFAPDLVLGRRRAAASQQGWFDRLRGADIVLTSTTTNAEAAGGSALVGFDAMDGYRVGDDQSGAYINFDPGSYAPWSFRRAPNFFDEVCYTGTGSATTVAHNLGVAPELMIVKGRGNVSSWPSYVSSFGSGYWLRLDTNGTISTTNVGLLWNNTNPTSSSFSVGVSPNVNSSGVGYVAYLFATCPGVSKVGSYTGDGSTQTINCGFAGGARFVLIKRTDSTGDWYVYDTARGMTTLTDPYLLLNSTAAESATLGSVTTVTTGFAVNASILAAINTNGASYIFLAIA